MAFSSPARCSPKVRTTPATKGCRGEGTAVYRVCQEITTTSSSFDALGPIPSQNQANGCGELRRAAQILNFGTGVDIPAKGARVRLKGTGESIHSRSLRPRRAGRKGQKWCIPGRELWKRWRKREKQPLAESPCRAGSSFCIAVPRALLFPALGRRYLERFLGLFLSRTASNCLAEAGAGTAWSKTICCAVKSFP